MSFGRTDPFIIKNKKSCKNVVGFDENIYAQLAAGWVPVESYRRFKFLSGKEIRKHREWVWVLWTGSVRVVEYGIVSH